MLYSIKRGDLEEIFEYVNNKSDRIRLTKEIECIDYKVKFFDCLVER